MQTPNGLKTKRINHLKWCLEQLKFRENMLLEEEFENLYRYIYGAVSKMEEMDGMAANEYFLKQMRKKDIIETLKRCNIELDV